MLAALDASPIVAVHSNHDQHHLTFEKKQIIASTEWL
jgi:hypothetical protein